MTTLFDRIWDAHVVACLPGGAALVAIDRVLLHERTGAAALNALRDAGRTVADPGRVFAMMDHIVDTLPGRTDRTLMPGGQAFITETRAAARAAGIRLFDVGDPDQGIMHVVSPELGIVLPGLTLIAPDSHTCTQGALGALAWGIGSSEAEHAMATGTLRLTRPRAMRVTFTGAPAPGVTAKDMMLSLIAAHGAGGGAGHVVEFAGPAVTALDMEARMTLCNMATEFSAFAGLIAPDDVTFAWLKDRRYAPQGADWDAALAQWQTLRSADDAAFDAEITLDAGSIPPMVSWGTSPQASVAVSGNVPADAGQAMLDYMALAAGAPLIGTPIDAAFIGSCTNARLSDLRRAAALLKGRHVAPGIRAICVPGSSAVRRAAEAEGLARVFVDAGFEWRMSGCSMCFFAGGESFAEGSRVISSTNRSFESRQGLRVKTHIASPETVAASAVAGAIADARELAHG
ncbi:MAG: 3-isopropylmalate dehydratase large subunit [Blastomonas fulva]|uniref:3-isopropylmalate dehydratase large subunit n=1 Tax=Blastomonas fulva TaxID=1550728 RepID=UPI0024E23350|nr:3-isopropylmalate dehydratase large subunit [Blastomonas fulva]MDK2758277.1 3-isopropylmalate dehydratase large subunit [Blastomonas fulva]